MKIFDAAQIRAWDAATLERENISSHKLMERAAKSCASWIEKEILSKKQHEQKPIFIFCGPGNNGGDGLAIARMISKKGRKIQVYVVNSGKQGSKDFERNFARLKIGKDHIHLPEIAEELPSLHEDCIVIDALFGSGLHRPLEGLFADAVHCINQAHATVIAVDFPSGMYIDKSSKLNPVVHATHTLSFQNFKLAFVLPENEDYIGTLHLLDIGLDRRFEKDEPAKWELVEKSLVRDVFRPRKSFSHKGVYGHALLIAGSFGKMGAATLSARGCLRSGAGLLTMHVPEIGYKIIQTTVPEAMVISGGEISFNLYKSVGMGPGCGTGDESIQILENLFRFIREKEIHTHLVLDADALNIMAADKRMLYMLPPGSILTPHPKEFARLFGETKDDFDRLETARAKAKELNCFIILKGHHTAICTPDDKVYINNTGNAGLATGGSGDVLTGILTGLATQGYAGRDCCLLGVFLHGLAGQLASEQHSLESMIAGDIPEFLGAAYRTLYNQ